MKRISLLLTFSFIYLLPQAQIAMPEQPHDTWTIKLNKKVILEAFKYGETENTRVIKQADLTKKGSLEIIYNPDNTKQQAAIKRSFILMDENDKELLRKDSTLHVTISTTDLKKLFGDKKKIMVFTIAIPANASLAARVRVKRVHLCTLLLQ